MAEMEADTLRERMTTRVKVVGQMGQRVTRDPKTQIGYMQDITKLLDGQARDAQRLASVAEAGQEAAMLERYSDALVAAGDTTTGGHEWAIIQRAMRDELPEDTLQALDSSEEMRTVKAASREAALMSWSPTADAATVDQSLERFWQAHEDQDRARTVNLGDVGSTYDRSRLVSQAWADAGGGPSVSERVRVRAELVNFAQEDPESPTGQMARDLIHVDQSNGTTQTKAWDEQMGRGQSEMAAKSGPSLDMVAGQEMTRPDTDPGMGR